MKSSHWAVVLLLLGLVVGFAVGGGVMDRHAMAQEKKGPVGVPPFESPPQPGRFQISAWGYAAGQGAAINAARGCYIVDTATGEMWHVAVDGSGGIPKKIGQKLQ